MPQKNLWKSRFWTGAKLGKAVYPCLWQTRMSRYPSWSCRSICFAARCSDWSRPMPNSKERSAIARGQPEAPGPDRSLETGFVQLLQAAVQRHCQAEEEGNLPGKTQTQDRRPEGPSPAGTNPLCSRTTSVRMIPYELSPPQAQGLIPLDEWFVLQQVDLVDKPYVVTEHRARKYLDPRTGRIVIAPLPVAVKAAGLVGPQTLGPGRLSERRLPHVLHHDPAVLERGAGHSDQPLAVGQRRPEGLGRLRRALCRAARGPGPAGLCRRG